jgi:hypothetical protein
MQFVYLPTFIKQIKDLAKKYPSIKEDFARLLTLLEKTPQTGTELGKDCYKIRMAITSKGKGKSGGARIITCVKIQNNSIYFLTIYDKSDQSTITDKELKFFINYIQSSYE